MKIVAGIQARMGSKRFPGKSLALLSGRPLIHWAIQRVQQSRLIDQVWVLTTTDSHDDPLVETIGDAAFVLRGDPCNVQSRYVQLAEVTGATHLVRVTADCPLLDGNLLDHMIAGAVSADAEYGHIRAQPYYERAYPNGQNGEIFPLAAFDKMRRLGTARRHREHVTLAVDENLDQFSQWCLEPPDELNRGHWKLSIDTPIDLMLIQRIVDALGPQAIAADIAAIVGVLDEQPAWYLGAA